MRQNPIKSERAVLSQDVVNPVSMEMSEEERAKVQYPQGESMSWSQQVINPVANKMNSDSGPAVSYQPPLPMRSIPKA